MLKYVILQVKKKMSLVEWMQDFLWHCALDFDENFYYLLISIPTTICQLESFEHHFIIVLCFRHGWYWGGITSSEAEKLLAGQHDNVFLVRDSYDSRHILCVSFRCVGRTLHARLRHANGLFSLNNETYVPANRISEHCATVAVQSTMFEMPVKLARPLNRYY